MHRFFWLLPTPKQDKEKANKTLFRFLTKRETRLFFVAENYSSRLLSFNKKSKIFIKT